MFTQGLLTNQSDTAPLIQATNSNVVSLKGALQVQLYPFYSSMCYFLTSISFHFNSLTQACMLLSTTFFSEGIK